MWWYHLRVGQGTWSNASQLTQKKIHRETDHPLKCWTVPLSMALLLMNREKSESSNWVTRRVQSSSLHSAVLCGKGVKYCFRARVRETGTRHTRTPCSVTDLHYIFSSKQTALRPREQSPDIVLIHECQDSTITPRLGVWLCDPTSTLPVETDGVVDETEGEFKYVSNLPRCLPFIVELDDPLSSQRNVATMGAWV